MSCAYVVLCSCNPKATPRYTDTSRVYKIKEAFKDLTQNSAWAIAYRGRLL